MRNILVKVDFIKGQSMLLLEYERIDINPDIATVRLVRKAANEGELYSLNDKTYRFGPVYEAVWLFGHAGRNSILSPKQLVYLEELIKKELHEGHTSIPENQIVCVGC